MIKGLIFDLDGTLVEITDYIPTFHKLVLKACRTCGGKNNLTLDMHKEIYKPLKLSLEESNNHLKKDWGVEPKRFWRELFKLDLVERRKAIENGILKCFDDISVIRELRKKYKIGLLSITPEEIAELELDSFGISNLFDKKVCGFYKCKLSKPEVKGIEICLKSMGLKPREAMMIGDSEVDIAVGKKVGMTTVQIIRPHTNSYKFHLESLKHADYSINSLFELKNILETIS